jgi:hypothetical protein
MTHSLQNPFSSIPNVLGLPVLLQPLKLGAWIDDYN